MQRFPELNSFILAVAYCFANTQTIEAAAQSLGEPILRLVMELTEEKTVLKKVKILKEIVKVVKYDSCYNDKNVEESVIGKILRKRDEVSETETKKRSVFQVEYETKTRNYCCEEIQTNTKYSNLYLKISTTSSLLPIEQKLSSFFNSKNHLQLCSHCHAWNQHVKTKVLTQANEVLILIIDSQACSATASLNLGEEIGVYSLEAIIEARPDGKYRGYFKKRDWFVVDSKGVSRLVGDINDVSCRVLIYSKDTSGRGIQLKKTIRVKSNPLFDVCLSCFANCRQFAMLCHQSKTMKCECFLSQISESITNFDSIHDLRSLLANMWRKFGEEFVQVKTPYDFLLRLFRMSNSDSKKIETILFVRFSTVKVNKCGCNADISTATEKAMLLKAPTKLEETDNAVWYAKDEFFSQVIYDDFILNKNCINLASNLSRLHGDNPKEYAEIDVQKCINYRLRAIFTEKHSSFCKHQKQIGTFQESFITEIGSLLLIQFFEGSSTGKRDSSCDLKTVLELNLCRKRFTLEGIVRKKKNTYVSYFKKAGSWVCFENAGEEPKTMDRLPETMKNVWVFVFEESEHGTHRKEEVSMHSSTSGGSLTYIMSQNLPVSASKRKSSKVLPQEAILPTQPSFYCFTEMSEFEPLPEPTTEQSYHKTHYKTFSYFNLASNLSRLHGDNPKEYAEIDVQKCINYRLRAIFTEKHSSFCKHQKQIGTFQESFITEIGSLLLIQFFEGSSTGKRDSSCDLKTVLELNLCRKRFTLEGIVRKKKNTYVSYFKKAGSWVCFENAGEEPKTMDRLPETMKNVWVFVFEESEHGTHRKEEVSMHSSTSGGSLTYIMSQNLPVSASKRKSSKVLPQEAILPTQPSFYCFTEMSEFEPLPEPTTEQSYHKTHYKTFSYFNFFSPTHRKTPRSSRETGSSDAAYTGLPNLGSTCYLNSILNCLYFSSRFTAWFPLFAQKNRSNLTRLIDQFLRLYQHGHTRQSISPILLEILSETDRRCDETECSNHFLAKLCSTLEPISLSHDESSISSLLSITEKTTTVCHSCRYSSSHSLKMWSLHLSPKDGDSVEDLMRKRYHQYRSEHFCERCKMTCDRYVEPVLVSLGSIVVIYVQKSQGGFHTTRVAYPAQIDLSHYLPDIGKYRLFAIVHLFEHTQNHVIADVRVQGRRYLFDDERVTEIDCEELDNGSCYMLWYEREETPCIPAPKGVQNWGNNGFMSSVWNSLYFTSEFRRLFDAGLMSTSKDFAKIFTSFVLSYQSSNNMSEIIAQMHYFPPDFYVKTPLRYLIWLLAQLDKDLEQNSVFATISSPYCDIIKLYRVDKSWPMHELFYIITENVYVCSRCEKHNETSSMGYSRLFDLEIPRKSLSNEDFIMFDERSYFNLRAYSSYYAGKPISEYIERALYYERTRRRCKIETAPNHTEVDLITCLKYQFRFQSMEEKERLWCQKCMGYGNHFRQLFVKEIGTVLVIHIKRQGNIGVRFGEDINLREFFGYSMMYHLTAVVNRSCERERYTAIVKVGRFWYEYDETTITEISSLASLSTTADFLIYQRRKSSNYH